MQLFGVVSALRFSVVGVSAVLLGWVSAGADEASPVASPASGIIYRNDRIAEGPLSVHIAKVDRRRTDLLLTTTLAKGTVLDLTPLWDQIKGLQARGVKVMAGINGDFYRTEREVYAGDPLGFQVMEGELVSSPYTNRPSFWLDAKGAAHLGVVESRFELKLSGGQRVPFQLNEERYRGTVRLYTPRLGKTTGTTGGRELVLERASEEDPWLPLKPCVKYRARVSLVRESGNSPIPAGAMVLSFDSNLRLSEPPPKVGDILELGTQTLPDTLGCETAIGGGPTLVRNGKVAEFKAGKDRHPRSAFGWNEDYWFFVEVDGRQSNLSIGMTIKELAEYLQRLGVKDAINLDGGGSATLWLSGQVVNSPCYGHERETANGLVVVRKDAHRSEPD